MKYTIAELIDLDQLQKVMEALYAATGINHALIDNDSNVLTAVGWEDVCTRYHRVNHSTCERCLASDRYILDHVHDGPYVGYRCPNGLVDYATPVIIEGEHLANIFTGQMFHEPPDLDYFRAQAKEFSFDEEGYLAAVQRVNIVPEERMESIMAFLSGLAGMLASNGVARLRMMAAEEELKRLNEELVLRVEDRTTELERSNAELQQFAYAVSHDLQEPLRMVTNYAQLLERRYADKLDETGREFIGYAVDGAKRASGMIRDLLDYSRVHTQGGAMEPILSADALHEAQGNLTVAMEEAGAELSVAGTLPVVNADAGQLARLFQNLVGNAIKYRAKKRPCRIEVSAEREGEFWRFAVRDNGIGIEPQYYERIFNVFQRLHPRGTYEGTGIGLSLCKRIVARHGGRIWVESEPGAGSTFFFTLPAAD